MRLPPPRTQPGSGSLQVKTSPLRRLLAFGLVAAGFFYLLRVIWRSLDELRRFPWNLNPLLLAISVALLAGTLVWGVVVWRSLLRCFGFEVPLKPLARAWFISNLGRYIPGVVWQFVSLAQLGTQAGLAGADAVSSLLVQMGFSLLAGGVVALLFLPPTLFPASVAEWVVPGWTLLRWATPLAILLVHPRAIRAGGSMVARLARKPLATWSGSWVDGIRLLLLSLVSWGLLGAAFWLFLRSLVPLPLSALPAVTAVNALAFIAGYLVVIAPGGWGVRELALGGLLSGLVPGGVAAALAIAARLWILSGELLPALLLLRRSRFSAAETPGLPSQPGPGDL